MSVYQYTRLCTPDDFNVDQHRCQELTTQTRLQLPHYRPATTSGPEVIPNNGQKHSMPIETCAWCVAGCGERQCGGLRAAVSGRARAPRGAGLQRQGSCPSGGS